MMIFMAKFLIMDVFYITGVGTVIVGRVEDGTLRVGMKLNVSGKIMEVRSIEAHHKQMIEANPGDPVGVSLRSNEDLLKKVFSLGNEDYNILKSYKNKIVEFL